MAASKSIDEQLADVKHFNEALRTQLKKTNEELMATRNNQRTLIDLLADTMKRLREAEVALENEKTKAALAPLLQRSARCTAWAAASQPNTCEAGARLYEALLCKEQPVVSTGCSYASTPTTAQVHTEPVSVSKSEVTEEEDLYT